MLQEESKHGAGKGGKAFNQCGEDQSAEEEMCTLEICAIDGGSPPIDILQARDLCAAHEAEVSDMKAQCDEGHGDMHKAMERVKIRAEAKIRETAQVLVRRAENALASSAARAPRPSPHHTTHMSRERGRVRDRQCRHGCGGEDSEERRRRIWHEGPARRERVQKRPEPGARGRERLCETKASRSVIERVAVADTQTQTRIEKKARAEDVGTRADIQIDAIGSDLNSMGADGGTQTQVDIDITGYDLRPINGGVGMQTKVKIDVMGYDLNSMDGDVGTQTEVEIVILGSGMNGGDGGERRT